jgi:hypothetical protein
LGAVDQLFRLRCGQLIAMNDPWALRERMTRLEQTLLDAEAERRGCYP